MYDLLTEDKNDQIKLFTNRFLLILKEQGKMKNFNLKLKIFEWK